MKNIIRYLMVTIFFTMFYFFIKNILDNPPSYASDMLLNGLLGLKTVMEKPFWIFSLFFDITFIEEHSLSFGFILSLLISIPITLFFSEKEDDYDKFINTQRPYILTEYEYVEKDPKDNILPNKKIDKFLDKLGLLKRTNIEKETYYNISIYLPEDVRKIFSYQVKRIKRVDRVFSPDNKKEIYSFISFKSLFGFISIKRFFSNKTIKLSGGKNEFILATVIFKDNNYENLLVDVWVKNLKIDRIVFRSNEDFDPKAKYDYKYSSTKINLIVSE